MKTKPTIASYSSITSYSTKTVKEKLAKLFESPSARPELPDFVEAVIADLSQTAAGRNKPSPEGQLDPHHQRARKDKEHADKLQMENELRRGELVEEEEIRRAWIQISTSIRVGLMALPSRMALEISAMDSPRLIQIRLDEEVRAVLTALADE
jgi:phage terminase Nu1 subunit (DNA packaging protein)